MYPRANAVIDYFFLHHAESDTIELAPVELSKHIELKHLYFSKSAVLHHIYSTAEQRLSKLKCTGLSDVEISHRRPALYDFMIGEFIVQHIVSSVLILANICMCLPMNTIFYRPCLVLLVADLLLLCPH